MSESPNVSRRRAIGAAGAGIVSAVLPSAVPAASGEAGGGGSGLVNVRIPA